jgi:hypothetical protein
MTKNAIKVRFTPHDPKYTTVEGLLVDTIKNQDDEPGGHIFCPQKGDPTRILRVWSSNGTLHRIKQPIKVTFDDGDWLETWINGTEEEIRAYYIGTRFTKHDETFHTALTVEFL